MRAVRGASGALRGRWIWTVSGVATAAVLTAPAIRIVTHAVSTSVTANWSASPAATQTRTLTVPQPVNAVTVDSYGAPVRITAGAVSRVTVTEYFSFVGKGPDMTGAAGGLPTVTDSVSDGRLTLADPACASGGGCEVSFALTVPRGTASTVTSAGGPVFVSGTSGQARIDSGGGVVNVSGLSGPLTAATGGGPLLVDDLSGALTADSGGGFVDAQGLTSADVSVTTGNGPAVLSFGTAPRSVRVATSGGSARVGVPGGPYALTADGGGGLESVEVATSPSAGRALTVSTGGGPLLIAPSVPGVPRPVKGIFLPGPGPDGPSAVFGGGPGPGAPAAPAAPSKP